MDLVVREGKKLEDVLEELASELNVSVEELIYKKDTKKGGLFKGETVIVSATTLNEIQSYIKEYLNKVLNDMSIETKFESSIRDNQITVKMYSEKNAILIGKNGQTLTALQTLIRQVVFNNVGKYVNIILDVENYKDKQKMHIERLAKQVAREVGQSKVEARLDDMNSYERRIVHEVLSNNKKVYTESAGEAPHRYVVIKPKEE